MKYKITYELDTAIDELDVVEELASEFATEMATNHLRDEFKETFKLIEVETHD